MLIWIILSDEIMEDFFFLKNFIVCCTGNTYNFNNLKKIKLFTF